MRRRTGPTDAADRGAMLVMAIVFITVIGLVLAGALSYATVSMSAVSRSYTPERDRLYAADAAVKTMAEYVVTHPSEGRSGSGCKAVRSYGEVNGEPVTVQVCPEGADSLILSGVAADPGFTALAVSPEVGLDINGGGRLAVNGNVRVASSINVAATTTLDVVGGAVSAPNGCTGTITVDGVAIDDATCPVGATSPTDPAYALGVTTPPPAATGSCNGSTKIATLQPGIWTTASALNSAIGSCIRIAMVPGVHVLSSVSWTIKDKVVAGTLNGPIATSPIPGGCVDDGLGVTIVLAGTSTIALSGSNASLQVCGRDLPQTSTRVALFGPPSNVATTLADTLLPTADPSGSGWNNPANARVVDGAVATSNSINKGNTTGTLTFSTLAGTAAFPTTTITPITAEVTGLATQAATFIVQVRSGGSTACTSTASPMPLTTLATVSVTFTCSRALAAPLSVRFTATAGSTGSARTVQVDGVVLKYNVAGAPIAAQSGCVVLAVGGCDAISMNNSGGQIWLGGRVYLPRAKMSLRLKDGATVVSTQGIVVRAMNVQTASPASVGSVASESVSVSELHEGTVTIAASIGDTLWTTCWVSFPVSGTSVLGADVRSCTTPR